MNAACHFGHASRRFVSPTPEYGFAQSIGETSVGEPRSSVVSLGLAPASRALNADVVSLAVGFGDAAFWTGGFE